VRHQSPIRIAALDGNGAALAGVNIRETPFEVVEPLENPDLVWDPASHDVLAGGDVVAYRIEKAELPGVIDRAAAVASIKVLTVKSPQPMKVSPDDRLHRSGTDLEVTIDDTAERALLLFNLAGDGTIQALYPVGSDDPVIHAPALKLPVRVRAPYGADRVIAVTSRSRMNKLESALKQFNQTRKPFEFARLIESNAPADVRIGSVGLFSGR
jgi:hypothetical protein